jgi:glycosyltransferase involved in cell wall biosynthesis
VTRIGIHYHTDPAARLASGIDSFIRGILRHAPPDLHYTLVGASTDPVARPPGRLLEFELDGRPVRFLPLIAIDADGRRGAVPLTVRYLGALARQRLAGRLPEFDVLDFHRIEPLALFGGDPRPKNLTLHQDMVVIRDPRSDILWRHAPALYEAVESRLIRRADRVFCVRRSAVQRYQAREPRLAPRFAFMPTWFDSTRFGVGASDVRAAARAGLRARFGWKDDARVMISVGRLDRQKDPLLLLEAALPLMARTPRLHLLLVGDGSLRPQVESIVRAAGCGGRIALAGARPADEIAMLLKGADLFVMSSAYEGMPIALLEALASGLPVVSTPVGEVPMLVREDVNGLLAAAATAPALRDALQCMLERHQGLPPPGAVAAAVAAYRPEVVLARVYDNHRRQARAPAPLAASA